MRKAHLLTTVAVSLLFAAAATAAENNHEKGKSELSNPAPAAQQKAPAEKIAPSMHAGQKTPETTGQAGASDKGAADLKSGRHETTGQAPKASDTDKAQMDESKEKSSGKADMNESKEKNSSKAEMNASKTGASAKESSESKSGESQKSSESVNGKASTTGQGAAAGANLSSTQRTKITTILKQHKVQPTHLNISVRVGASVPASVHFYPLPPEVVTIYPEWRGYDYILVGDQIIVINPRSHTIVAVLEA